MVKKRLKFDENHSKEEIKMAEIAATEAAKLKEHKKEKIELEAKLVKDHVVSSLKKLHHASVLIVIKAKQMIVHLKKELGSAKQRLNKKISEIKRETQEKIQSAEETTKDMIKENQLNAADLKQEGEKVVKTIQAEGDSKMYLAREQYKLAKLGIRNKATAQQEVLSQRPSSKQNNILLKRLDQFLAN